MSSVTFQDRFSSGDDDDDLFVNGLGATEKWLIQSAYIYGRTFPLQVAYLLKKKALPRTVARQWSYTAPDVRGEDLPRSYLGLEEFFMNDWMFKRELASQLGCKNTNEIDKKLGRNLKLDSTEKAIASLLNQMRRVEMRYLLNNVDVMEAYGRLRDQRDFLIYLLCDIIQYGYTDKIEENIMSMGARLVDPNFDHTTCTSKDAVIVRRDDYERKEGDVDEYLPGPVLGAQLPAPTTGTGVTTDGLNLFYDLNIKFRCKLSLKTPIVIEYIGKRNNYRSGNNSNSNNSGKSSYSLFDRAVAKEQFNFVNGRKWCFWYNFGPLRGYGCRNPNCNFDICCICGEGHPWGDCRLAQATTARIAVRKDWPWRVPTQTFEQIYERRFHGSGGRGGRHDRNHTAGRPYTGNKRSRDWQHQQQSRRGPPAQQKKR